MAVLAFLLFVGAIVMGAVIFFGMLGDDVMPWSCPRCAAGSDDRGGMRTPWYRHRRHGGVECRTCHTAFKEGPTGVLVEDHDA